MYTEVGAFDAEAKLPALLRTVQEGQRYTITLRGRPVADLVPSESTVRQDAQAAVEATRDMLKMRRVSAEAFAK
jgi:prevent-host-death family protein